MDVSVTAAGRQVTSQQTRPLTRHSMTTDEREKGTTVPKQNIEARKPRRRLVRPRLEQPGEPTVDTRMPAMDGSTEAEGRPSTSHEPEGEVSVPHSVRKRLAPSLSSELREDSVAHDDANDDVTPPLKSKDTEFVQEGSEGQSIPSTSANPDTVQQLVIPSSDNFDAPLPIEDSEAEHASALLNEENVDIAKDEDTITTKEEIEDQQKVPQDGMNQDEAQYEGDEMAEDISEKPRDAVELLDDFPKSEDAKELPQSTVEGDDEREEGELIPDESEQQQEDGALEVLQEPIVGDEIGLIGEIGDTIEPLSLDVLSEKSEGVDVIEEAAEALDKSNNNNNDHGGVDATQSPQPSSAVCEDSPTPLPLNAVPEQQSPSAVPEKLESRVGRTISLRESTMQGRQTRMATPPLPTAVVGLFLASEGTSRGRSGRGGRGQAFNDRDQS